MRRRKKEEEGDEGCVCVIKGKHNIHDPKLYSIMVRLVHRTRRKEASIVLRHTNVIHVYRYSLLFSLSFLSLFSLFSSTCLPFYLPVSLPFFLFTYNSFVASFLSHPCTNQTEPPPHLHPPVHRHTSETPPPTAHVL
jgi:hypothetical protein